MSANYEWTEAGATYATVYLRGEDDPQGQPVTDELLLMLATLDNGVGISGTREQLLNLIEQARQAVTKASPPPEGAPTTS